MSEKRRKKKAAQEGRGAAPPAETTAADEVGESRPGLLGQMKAAGARLTRTGRDEMGEGTSASDAPRARTGRRPLTPEERMQAEATLEWERQARMLGEVATLIWHLKTRHFGQEWSDPDPDSDVPKDRRALTRIQRTVDALERSGVTIEDPTGWRYPDGGEGWMKPVQITPTQGVSESVVTNTVKPIVYRDDRLIQRGEVFVASPTHEDEAAPESGDAETTTGVDDEPDD